MEELGVHPRGVPGRLRWVLTSTDHARPVSALSLSRSLSRSRSCSRSRSPSLARSPAIEAGYFAGLLFASQRIRQQTYRALPTQYFGDFIRTANIYPQWPVPVPSDGEMVVFNPPKGCSEGETPVLGFPDYTEPNGIQTCPPSTGQLNWNIFPWVSDTNGLGQLPGCAQAGNSTVITYQSSPAYTGDGVAETGYESQICQNFLFAAGETNNNGTA